MKPAGVNISKILIFTCVTQYHERKNYEKYILIILFLICYSKQKLKTTFRKVPGNKILIFVILYVEWAVVTIIFITFEKTAVKIRKLKKVIR